MIYEEIDHKIDDFGKEKGRKWGELGGIEEISSLDLRERSHIKRKISKGG